jgi:hypothetical protein
MSAVRSVTTWGQCSTTPKKLKSSKDSNSVYDALENAATAGEVDEKQDWERGLSKWTFPDGSRILMEGADITVVAARR